MGDAINFEIRSLHYLCNISRKMWGMKLIFCMKINAEVFFKLIVSLWVSVARHTQSTQNNKLAISMQYLKQNVNDEVDFLPEDKHQRFLQIDTTILGVCAQACPDFWLLVTRVMWILYEVNHRVQWVMRIPLIENIEPVIILWQILLNDKYENEKTQLDLLIHCLTLF